MQRQPTSAFVSVCDHTVYLLTLWSLLEARRESLASAATAASNKRKNWGASHLGREELEDQHIKLQDENIVVKKDLRKANLKIKEYHIVLLSAKLAADHLQTRDPHQAPDCAAGQEAAV